MINSIIRAVSITLDAEFDEKEYSFHMEEMKQDLKEPCFFIACLNPTHKLFLGKRYFRQNQFVIQYFPESKEELQAECNAVAERMAWCLEYITVPGDDKPIMGTKMKYQIIDGVLNFFVNYDCFVYKVEQNEAMESLESNTKVKEGD